MCASDIIAKCSWETSKYPRKQDREARKTSEVVGHIKACWPGVSLVPGPAVQGKSHPRAILDLK